MKIKVDSIDENGLGCWILFLLIEFASGLTPGKTTVPR